MILPPGITDTPVYRPYTTGLVMELNLTLLQGSWATHLNVHITMETKLKISVCSIILLHRFRSHGFRSQSMFRIQINIFVLWTHSATLKPEIQQKAAISSVPQGLRNGATLIHVKIFPWEIQIHKSGYEYIDTPEGHTYKNTSGIYSVAQSAMATIAPRYTALLLRHATQRCYCATLHSAAIAPLTGHDL